MQLLEKKTRHFFVKKNHGFVTGYAYVKFFTKHIVLTVIFFDKVGTTFKTKAIDRTKTLEGFILLFFYSYFAFKNIRYLFGTIFPSTNSNNTLLRLIHLYQTVCSN